MPPKNNLKNRKINNLLCLLDTGERRNGKVVWLCKCDCGNTITTTGTNLISGDVKHCGCLKHKNRYRTHNKSKHRLYKIWQTMKQRCNNPKNSQYKYYGDRGISVCKEWQNNFEVFYNWAIKNGYKDNLTIDRTNYNGNYKPSNCRWATRQQQSLNTRRNHLIFYNGEEKPLTQWARKIGLKPVTLFTRLSREWSIKKAMTPLKPSINDVITQGGNKCKRLRNQATQ